MTKFRRRFTSFTILLSFSMLLLSGIAMYLRPEGSIADWIGWTFLGLTKKGWESVHTAGALLFTITVLFHLWNNLHALGVYLRKKPWFGMPKEALGALAIAAAVGLAGIMDWEPAAVLNSVRSSIKKGTLSARYPPPVENAAALPLHEFSKASDIRLDRMIAVIEDRSTGEVDSSMTVADAARLCRLSPEALYHAFTVP